MSHAKPTELPESLDWDRMYREGLPPWETNKPAAELQRILGEGLIPRGNVLELGCGTGADAICLAQHGFDVTAVDMSPIAIERARRRGRQENALVRFVLDDVYEFAQHAGEFDFVYDASFYHFARRNDLDRFLDMLWRITRPGSLYLTLAGNDDEKAEGGPPTVTEHEIHFELGRLLDVVQLRPFQFESPNREEGYLGWSCLMTRPESML
jgi:methyl halide transferase